MANTTTKAGKKGFTIDFSPRLFSTLKGYNKQRFTKDLMAGIIVGIVAIPLAIAFGIASGVGPTEGLVTAIIAGFISPLVAFILGGIAIYFSNKDKKVFGQDLSRIGRILGIIGIVIGVINWIVAMVLIFSGEMGSF